MNPPLSLQERYAPGSICFGCGPANAQGLHLRSFPEGELLLAEWLASPHHQAFPGVLNGGIAGALLDCHANWAAAWRLMQRDGLAQPPCTVTADYAVKLIRPTPVDNLIRLTARILDASADRARVAAELSANGKICATCTGLFVAVKPGHPAYHRW